VIVGGICERGEEKVGERSLLMANTMGGTEWNAQQEQEGRKNSQPASEGGEAS
jgi:hypothetical protein